MKKIIFALVMSLMASSAMSTSSPKPTTLLDYRLIPFEELVDRANKGDGIAQYRLSGLYSLGSNKTKQDDEIAAYWWKKAALSLEKESQSDDEARYLLSGMYLRTGWGVEKDITKAFTNLEKVAQNGHLLAGNRLADIYHDGSYGIEKNPQLAEDWYSRIFPQAEKDAQQGNTNAQSILANIYYKSATRKNEDQVLFWKRQLLESRRHYITQVVKNDYPLDFHLLLLMTLSYTDERLVFSQREGKKKQYFIYSYLRKHNAPEFFSDKFDSVEEWLRLKLKSDAFYDVEIEASRCTEIFTPNCY